MKRSRTRRLSTGGSSLFTAFLLVPLVVRCVITLAAGPANVWVDLLLVLCIVFFCVLLWFASLRNLASDGSWKLPRSWYEACFALAALFVVFAAFVFISGRTPSRYNSRPVPRREGIHWLGAAALPAAAGAVALLLEKRKRPKNR